MHHQKHYGFLPLRSPFSGVRLFSFMFIAFVTLLMMNSKPASAQTCVVVTPAVFPASTVDFMLDSPATTSAKIYYKCTSPKKFKTVTICAYVQTTDPNQIGSDDHTFHQLQRGSLFTGPSLLAWQMVDHNNWLYRRWQTTAMTGGSTTGSASERNEMTLDLDLFVEYLPRDQQNRVRSGRYSTEYRLAAQYEFDSPNDCDNPSATISSTRPVVSKFTLTADVLKGCQLENTDVLLDFGKVGAVSATREARANTNIDVRCTYETDYQLTLDNGRNFKDGFRRMKSGNNFIPYQLYSGSGTSVPWTKVSGKGAPVNSYNSHPIEGGLAPVTIAPATGIYNDTVIMTLTF